MLPSPEHRPAPTSALPCHSDSAGNDEYNTALTQGRAESVRDALAQRSAPNVGAKGYGEDKPIADNKTADGREQNRRCEIRID